MGKFYPQKGQYYYLINSRFEIAKTKHNGSQKSNDRIKAGNAFKKHVEAEQFRAGMLGLRERISKRWWEFWR